MQVKTVGNEIIMSNSLVCPNYIDMRHFNSTFDKVNDNEYKCTYCDAVVIAKEPVLTHEENGRLKMQVSFEIKQ